MSSPARSIRAPLLWLLVPLMAGFAAAQVLPPPDSGLALPLAGAALLAVLALGAAGRDRVAAWAVAQALAVALAGFSLLHLRYPFLHDWSSRPPREVTVSLRVTQVFAATPTARSTSGLGRIVAGDPMLAGRPVAFSVLRRFGPPPATGGVYRVRGVLEPLPPEAPDGFTDYLLNCGVRHRLGRGRVLAEEAAPGRWPRLVSAAHRRLQSWLSAGTGDRPALRSLYLGIVLGDKAVFSPEQQEAFVRSGTFHVFSVSGLHVGAVALLLAWLRSALRVPPRPAAVVTVVVLWLYVQVTGASAPAMRAFVMAALLLAARDFRLPANAFAALVASALLTLFVDPLQLFSSGFQMSYLVVATLILLGGPLADRWLERWRPFALLPPAQWRRRHHAVAWSGRKLLLAAAGCWAALLGSTPATVAYFGLVSPVSLLANLAAIPLSTAILAVGLGAMGCGAVGLPWLAAWLNQVALDLVALTTWLNTRFAAWPGGWVEAQFRAAWLGPVALAVMAATMLAGAGGGWRRARGGFWLPVAVLAVLFIFGVKFGGTGQSFRP